MLKESFRTRFDYEIFSVQKVKEEIWGWLISTTSTQATKFIQHLVPYQQDLFHVITLQATKVEKRAKQEGLTEDELKKKKCHHIVPLWTIQDEESRRYKMLH